jgi:glycerol-3-phosphate dehydrogenase (NAD(P)+)
VTLWARNPDTVDEINREHTQPHLPARTPRLPDSLRATPTSARPWIGGPGRHGHPVAEFPQRARGGQPHLRPWVPVISLTKGLELDTRMRMTEIINELVPGPPRLGVLTGPNLAREIMAGQAAARVIAMEDEIIVRSLQQVFKSGLFRVYTNTDVIGCELGGVLKNIIAIAVGMGDGLRVPVTTRARP